MSDRHFNNLKPDEAERLAYLLEELGEAQQIIGKILRHGYESSNPHKPSGVTTTNRGLLEEELGDVRAAMIMLCSEGDLSKEYIHDHAENKLNHVKKWMHHQ